MNLSRVRSGGTMMFFDFTGLAFRVANSTHFDSGRYLFSGRGNRGSCLETENNEES